MTFASKNLLNSYWKVLKWNINGADLLPSKEMDNYDDEQGSKDSFTKEDNCVWNWEIICLYSLVYIQACIKIETSWEHKNPGDYKIL